MSKRTKKATHRARKKKANHGRKPNRGRNSDRTLWTEVPPAAATRADDVVEQRIGAHPGR